MRRAGEMCTYLFVTEAETSPDSLPDSLLTGGGKGYVDSIQRHPVYEAFPLLPSPPRHRVAESAIVKVEPPRHPCRHTHFFRNRRKGFRHLDGMCGIFRYRGLAIIVQVVVETHGHCSGVVGGNDYLPPFRAKFEDICAVRWDFAEFYT